jgi:hypothetical protein
VCKSFEVHILHDYKTKVDTVYGQFGKTVYEVFCINKLIPGNRVICLLLLFNFPDIYMYVLHVCFQGFVDILLLILRFDLLHINVSVTQ